MIFFTIGISSSSKGGQWHEKWKEAGQKSQQSKSPPSPQASQQSWLCPFPEKHNFKYLLLLFHKLNNKSFVCNFEGAKNYNM